MKKILLYLKYMYYGLNFIQSEFQYALLNKYANA